jgi:hypothetical protein
MWAAVVGDGLSCELLVVMGDGSEVDRRHETQKLAIFLTAGSGKGLNDTYTKSNMTMTLSLMLINSLTDMIPSLSNK